MRYYGKDSDSGIIVRMHYGRLWRIKYTQFEPGGKAGAGGRGRTDNGPYGPGGKCGDMPAGFWEYTAK